MVPMFNGQPLVVSAEIGDKEGFLKGVAELDRKRRLSQPDQSQSNQFGKRPVGADGRPLRIPLLSTIFTEPERPLEDPDQLPRQHRHRRQARHRQPGRLLSLRSV